MVQLAGVSPGKGMDRHVLPLGAAVMLDESGFLDVAMADAWWVAPEDRPVPVTELCGRPGVSSCWRLTGPARLPSWAACGLVSREPSR